ncbi:hypothetical protein [Nostoc sp.]|uniref:hypothetical protein n=1 Tax=Nostoc sp. TaxID=1180 RepID=UPI002FFA48CA
MTKYECTKILNIIKHWIEPKMLEGSYFKGSKITTNNYKIYSAIPSLRDVLAFANALFQQIHKCDRFVGQALRLPLSFGCSDKYDTARR